MRCINCGWDNLSNTTVCLKCGQPLLSSEVHTDSSDNIPHRRIYGESTPKPTVLNANINKEKCRQTVAFSAINEYDNHSTIPKSMGECSHCGYPVVGKFESCPNCGSLLNKVDNITDIEQKRNDKGITYTTDEKVLCQKCDSEIPISFSFCPNCGSRVHRPTIRRQIKSAIETEPKIVPRCSLTIIPEDNEGIDSKKLEYEGTTIELNRENTDICNRTITTKEQAELIFENNHWYIIDRSELKSTYIQANRKLEIIPEDIIILGDRRFKFTYDCD